MGDETSNDDGNWEIVPCAGGIRWRSQYFDTLRKRRRTISNKRISIFHLVFAKKKKKWVVNGNGGICEFLLRSIPLEPE